MSNNIKFQDNNHLSDKKRKDFSDLQWIEEFYLFVQGVEVPKGITIAHGHQPKMSAKKANAIIWYLQEHLRVLPDHIDRCCKCSDLFDSWSSGFYYEKTGKNYCSHCMDSVIPWDER